MANSPPNLADLLREADPATRRLVINSLSPAELDLLRYDWYGTWARPQQQIPLGAWRYWMNMAGRGFGKTRTILEWARDRVEHQGARRMALVARTKADVRDVLVQGESGILNISPPSFMPLYEPSKRLLTWPNGAQALLYSADEPDQLRGPEHDTAVADELASWQYPEAWSNLDLGLRLKGGPVPQVAIGTTPKRVALIRQVLKLPRLIHRTGSTYDNKDNLDPTFLESIRATYEGTRLGLQELHGRLLDDNPDALWAYDQIEKLRRKRPDTLRRIVVAVDPEASNTEESAETGIIVAGRGYDEHFYVLADYTVRGTPAIWGRAVADAARTWEANVVIGEVNNGGDMVGFVIQQADPTLAYKAVRATRGKLTRAEPVSMMYEKGFAHHCGIFPDLEAQMIEWVPGEKSPDRMDALVWAGTELMIQPSGAFGSPAVGPSRPALVGYRYDT